MEGIVRSDRQPADAGRQLRQRALQDLMVEARGRSGLGAVPPVEHAGEEAHGGAQLAAAREAVDAGAAARRHQQPGAAGGASPFVLPGRDLEGEEGLVGG